MTAVKEQPFPGKISPAENCGAFFDVLFYKSDKIVVYGALKLY